MNEGLADRLRLYLITPPDAAERADYASCLAGALRGGVGAVQLRLKKTPVRQWLDLGRRLLPLVRAANAILVVNDRFDVALALGADGVHLGAEDLALPAVRAAAPGLIVGATVRNAAEAAERVREGAAYLGYGAVYPSRTKTESPVGGLAPLAAVVAAAGGVPVVGIGGIGPGRCAALCQQGVAGVAVVGALDGRSGAECEQQARLLIRELGNTSA